MTLESDHKHDVVNNPAAVLQQFSQESVFAIFRNFGMCCYPSKCVSTVCSSLLLFSGNAPEKRLVHQSSRNRALFFTSC